MADPRDLPHPADHTPEQIRRRLDETPEPSHLRDFVYGAIDGAMSRAQDWFIRVTRSRSLAAGLITVLVAIVYGFVDPGFGFDVVSLRLVLSLAIAFFALLLVLRFWLNGLRSQRHALLGRLCAVCFVGTLGTGAILIWQM